MLETVSCGETRKTRSGPSFDRIRNSIWSYVSSTHSRIAVCAPLSLSLWNYRRLMLLVVVVQATMSPTEFFRLEAKKRRERKKCCCVPESSAWRSMADIRLQGLIGKPSVWKHWMLRMQNWRHFSCLDNACKPGTPRFDLKLGKQICDLVNEKQGSL